MGTGVLRTLAVAAGYAILLTAADTAEATVAGESVPAVLFDSLPIRVAGGLLLGVTLNLIAGRLPGSRRRHGLIWWTLVFLSTAGVIVEGWAFAPGVVSLASLPWSLIVYAVVAAVVAGILVAIYDQEQNEGTTLPALPSR